MTIKEILWETVPLLVMFIVGAFVGVCLTSMAAAGSRDSRVREKMEEEKHVET